MTKGLPSLPPPIIWYYVRLWSSNNLGGGKYHNNRMDLLTAKHKRGLNKDLNKNNDNE